jgi:predicted methyltransferase
MKLGTCAVLSVVLASAAFADLAPDFMEKLQSDARPAEDRARDGARRPYQVLQKLGIDEGMTVVDVGAGGGWYTRVLSAAVGPRGKVISQVGPRALEQNNGQAQKDLAASLGNVEPGFENVGDMDSNFADAAVTMLNLHHANDERGLAAMQDLFGILKPGGMAAISDHIANPGTPGLHRMSTMAAKGWIEAAGFEIVEESDILRTSADDHTLSVDAPELGRNVDRFLFIVRKPD